MFGKKPQPAAPAPAQPAEPSELTQQKAKLAKSLLAEKYKSNSVQKTAQTKQETGESAYQQLLKSRMSLADFTIIKVIGKGAFGEVLLVKKNDTGEVLAMKKLIKEEMLKKKQTVHVRQERDILAKSDNPWIVKLFYSFQDEEYLFLCMEFLQGGDLMTWLITKEIFSEEQTRFYVAELVLAVESIHKMNYVHRDLKPDNILLDNGGHLKLTDFGLCKPFEEAPVEWDGTMFENEPIQGPIDSIGKYSTLQKQESWIKSRQNRELLYSTVGSPGYIAPEVLLKKGYRFECDWWSVGVIMFECIYGFPPFYAEDPIKTCQKIVRWKHFLEFPEDVNVSSDAVDLLQQLLTDGSKRIGTRAGGIQEIKDHPFFKGIDWNSIRSYDAPFKPQVSTDLDTKYFDEFDDAKIKQELASGDKGVKKVHLQKDEDILFKGFTFKRGQFAEMKKKAEKDMSAFGPLDDEKK